MNIKLEKLHVALSVLTSIHASEINKLLANKLIQDMLIEEESKEYTECCQKQGFKTVADDVMEKVEEAYKTESWGH